MDLLFLGGTRFVGRAIVEAALTRGHRVTLVHRGLTGDDLFQGQVEAIHADRLESLDGLRGRSWDACVDTCAYFPRAVRIAADVLGGSVGRYLLISTISVYDSPPPGSDESAGVCDVGDPDSEVVGGASYGFLKALCEREAATQFGGRALILRPSLVVGPNDHTDRFTYWPVRIATQRHVVVPAGPARPLQWIDARDQAQFALKLLEESQSGTYHVCGPDSPLTLRAALEAVRAELNPSCEFVDADLEAEGIEPWTDLPMVASPEDGLFQLSPRRAIDAGLTFTPLGATARDIWEWRRTRPEPLMAGMSEDRHRELITRLTGSA